MLNSTLYMLIQNDLDEFKKELKDEIIKEVRRELKEKEIASSQSQATWSNSPIATEVEKLIISK